MCFRHSDISGKRWSIQVRLALRMPLSGPALVTVTGSFSAAAMSGPLRAVVADQQPGVGQVLVRGHREVVRRRLVLVDAPGEVEERPVARTVEAAFPVAREGLGLGLELVHRRTAEMGADAYDHQVFGL